MRMRVLMCVVCLVRAGHFLRHEDLGMMSTFLVEPSSSFSDDQVLGVSATFLALVVTGGEGLTDWPGVLDLLPCFHIHQT
jgi:hypothetical protein